MMKFLYSIIFCFIIFYCSAMSPSKDSVSYFNQYLYLELLGDGGLYSINFDNKVFENHRLELSITIGFSYFFFVKEFNDFYGPSQIFGLKIYYKFSEKNNVGLDIAFSYAMLKDTYSSYEDGVLSPGISYKYYFGRGKYYFKAKVSPFYTVISDEKVLDEVKLFPLFTGIGFGIAL